MSANWVLYAEVVVAGVGRGPKLQVFRQSEQHGSRRGGKGSMYLLSCSTFTGFRDARASSKNSDRRGIPIP